jgi:short-subunit dehydrogenase
LTLGTAERFLALSAERVARVGYRGFMRGRRVVVPGLGNKLAAVVVRFVPHAILLRAADTRPRARGAASRS